jgi:hypothetical protein
MGHRIRKACKNNNAVSEKLADNFFASFGHKNREINIEESAPLTLKSPLKGEQPHF